MDKKDLSEVINCPRCAGYGQVPLGKCSVCVGIGSASRFEIIENYQYMKESHEECWNTKFNIPTDFLPENNPDYNGDVFDSKF